MKEEMSKKLNEKLTIVDHTGIEWLQSRKYRYDNKSGFRGVVLRDNGSYIVNIGFKQKRYYLGTYQTYEEAVKARLQAEDLIHGGFVRACKKLGITGGQDTANGHSGLLFEVKKGNGFIEINSSDEEENGNRMTFGSN